MRGRRIYGQSRNDTCPFCGKRAITENSQGVPVCLNHKNSEMPLMKCVCGEYLDLLKGKFGVFFNCINCGNMNLSKALEINHPLESNNQKKEDKTISKDNKEPKELTPEDIDIYYS